MRFCKTILSVLLPFVFAGGPEFGQMAIERNGQKADARAHRQNLSDVERSPLERFLLNDGIPYGPPPQSEAVWVDRFGYPIPKISPSLGKFTSALVPASINCDGFQLDFEDVMMGNSKGFNDPTPIPPHPCGATTSGELRQCSACQVFEYLGDLINFAPGAMPDILFRESGTDGTEPPGQASEFYSATLGNPQGGTLHDHIVNGNNDTPNPGQYDAWIKMDFGPHPLGNMLVPINSDPEIIDPTQLDLYTIILHEAVHALGFASLIDATGKSIISGSGSGAFALFDQFLVRGGTAGHLLSSGQNPSFVGVPEDLVSNKVEYFESSNAIPRHPIFSPDPYEPGSSLSHFDRSRAPADLNGAPFTGVHFNYVMGSGVPARELTDPELEVLCNLGYDLGDICDERYPVGINDGPESTTPGSMVCIDVLTNDIDLDGDPLFIDPTCGVQIINGNGPGADTDIDGSMICYTPPPNFVGTAVLTYCPTDGTRTGNETKVLIEVEGTSCPKDPCNLVCNGGFEGGVPPNTPLSFQSFDQGAVDNWRPSRGTPDLYIRNSPTCGFGIPRNFFSCNSSPCIIPLPCTVCSGGINTWDFPALNNDRYVGMLWNGQPEYEGMSTKLVTPLTPGRTYRLTFYAITVNRPGFGQLPVPGLVFLGLSTSEPVPSPTGTQNTAVDLALPQQEAALCDGNNKWTKIEVPFTVPASLPGLTYLIIEPKSFTQLSRFLDEYVFIDDVRLEEEGPPLQFLKSVDDPTPEIGETVTYTLEVCNLSSVDVTNVVIEDLLPTGLVPVGGTFQYPTHTIPKIPASSCFTLTLEAFVTSIVPINTLLTNCGTIESPVATCGIQSDNCTDITVYEIGCVQPPSDLVAWWPLDEQSGPIAFDISGLKNYGTHIGDPNPDPNGKVAGALIFDGMDDLVEVPDPSNDSLDFGQDSFTIDAYVLPAVRKTMPIIFKGGLSSPGYFLALIEDNGDFRLGVSLIDDSGTTVQQLSDQIIPVGTSWAHVAVVVNRNQNKGRFYINGVLDPNTFTPPPGSLDATAPLIIGRISGGPIADIFYAGKIDEVEIFNRALSELEIKSIIAPGKCKGAICGMKFNDLNGDGVKGDDEPGLAGWTIVRTDSIGDPVGEAITDEQGNYCFTDLDPGTYTVTEMVQNGWTPTAPPGGTTTVDLQLGQFIQLNFGNHLEDPCEGVSVTSQFAGEDCCWILTLNNNGSPNLFSSIQLTTVSPVEIASITPSTGWVQSGTSFPTTVVTLSLADLSPIPLGSTTVATICLNPGTALPQEVIVEWLDAPDAVICIQTLPFDCEPTCEIHGMKFHDLNGNGVREEDEPGLAGWTITLTDATGNTQTATTDEDGHYWFMDLASGMYGLAEILLDEWVQTFPPPPNDQTSGAHSVELAAGQVVEDIDFGNIERCLRIENETIACNPDGTFSYTFDLTNLYPVDVKHVFLVPISPSGLTIAPIITTLDDVISFGEKAPIRVVISGASSGTEICFRVATHDARVRQCCSILKCIKLPDCETEPCVLDPGLLQASNTLGRKITLAQTFTPINTGFLEKVIHGLRTASGAVSTFNLYITTTVGGVPPTDFSDPASPAVLYRALGLTDFASAGVNGVHTIPSSQHPRLSAGATYALILEPGHSGLMLWRGNSSPGAYANGAASELNGGNWVVPTTGPRDHGFRLEGRCITGE